MEARPYWSGQIRLSLVSFPIRVYPALNRAHQIPMHEIYRPTGERVRHQKVAGGEAVEKDDIVKGYEYEKGQYVLIEPGEIDKLKVPSSDTLDLVQFIPAAEIDEIYFETPYYVVPDGSEATFAVIREALRGSGKLALGQLAIGGRERLCSLKPCGPGMLLETLHYKEEIRKAAPFFDAIKDAKVDKDELSLARELITRKTAHFHPEKFHDHYRDALKELIDAKVEHRPMKQAPAAPSGGKVINLMDALRKSLSTGEKNPPAGEKPGKTRKGKPATGKKPARKRKAG